MVYPDQKPYKYITCIIDNMSIHEDIRSLHFVTAKRGFIPSEVASRLPRLEATLSLLTQGYRSTTDPLGVFPGMQYGEGSKSTDRRSVDLENDAGTKCRSSKDHIEHAWSTDIQERIVQLYFQLVRIDIDTQWENIRVPLESLLRTLSESPNESIGGSAALLRNANASQGTDPQERPQGTVGAPGCFATGDTRNGSKGYEYPMYISVLFRMLLHTRDIVSGKGEYALAYRMILSWYTYFPALAVHALKTFVISDDDESQPFGSWKDMKCMADVCKQQTGNARHELIQMCIQWINAQLKIDSADSADSKDSPISLCAKWVPREGSRYAWLFKALAEDYYSDTKEKSARSVDFDRFPGENRRETFRTDTESAKKKAYTHYRKLLAGLNRRLDTVQIKQCGNVWADIDHHKTTSITLSRNSKAFLNLTQKKEERSDRPDRIECARKFKEYVDSRVQRGLDVKGGRMGMNDFTKRAMALTKHIYDDEEDTISINGNQTEIDLLNAQWRSNAASQQMGNMVNMVNMVAMVDTSSSMTGDPLHAAIALGIRVAEHSVLGKRVLTFSTTPTWHNLEGKYDFVSMVDSLQGAAWGGSTNFYAALKLILDALVDQHVPPADAEGLVLAIFSDMQIDLADSSYARAGMHDTIRQMYQDAGYTCPHILFWNLRSTSGFPCMSSTPNTSMMSGFSPALLNVFCEKGPEALKTATPWNMMLETLNAPRYTTSRQYRSET
jgi:hypothetical protein